MRYQKLIIIWLISCILTSIDAYSTNLVFESFEDAQYNDGDPLTWNVDAGVFTISSLEKHDGVLALKSGTTGEQRIYAQDMGNSSSFDFWLSFWTYIPSGTADTYFNIKDDTNDDGGYVDFFGVSITTADDLSYNNGTWHDTGVNVVLDQWNKFETFYDSGEGKFTYLYLNDVQVDIGTGAGITPTFYGLYFYDTKHNVYLDEIYFNDTNVIEIPCVNNYTNTTKSDWFNFTDCIVPYVSYQQILARNWTVYDSNNCGNYTNSSAYEYLNQTCNLFALASTEEENMNSIIFLALVILYCFLTWYGFTLLFKGNVLIAVSCIVSSLGLDLYFIAYLYNLLSVDVVDSTWQSIFIAAFIVLFSISGVMKAGGIMFSKIKYRG